MGIEASACARKLRLRRRLRLRLHCVPKKRSAAVQPMSQQAAAENDFFDISQVQ